MNHIGNTNEVPGNEGTPLVPVYQLTDDQQAVQVAVKHLAAAYAESVAATKKYADQLSKLTSECKHHVHKDEAGFPYNQRWCVICGSYLGLL